MDGESLLYIILAIVYFVVSIMGSSKKAKKKREEQRRAAEQQEAGDYTEGMPEETAPRRPTFQEMLETLMEEERPSRPEVPEVPEVSEAAQMELERQEALARRMREAEVRRQKQVDFEKKLRTDMPAMALKTMRKTRQEGKLFENVSARQAVIAREILDRRYT